MSNKSILIASPIQQKPEVLEKFLLSLQKLDDSNLEISFLFIDDNTEAESKKLLQQFAYKSSRKMIINWESNNESYIKDETTHYWSDTLMVKVGSMKDEIISIALKCNYDALFLIDSDLLLYPDTIIKLFSTEKEIISNVFWTKWNPQSLAMPQVWFSDEYCYQSSSEQSKVEKILLSLIRLRAQGIYEVGGLGACTLIRREALLKGVSFKKIRNLPFWGEDRHFCVRAAALGIPLYVDTRQPAYHIYRDSDLEGAAHFLETAGNNPQQIIKEANDWIKEVLHYYHVIDR